MFKELLLHSHPPFPPPARPTDWGAKPVLMASVNAPGLMLFALVPVPTPPCLG